MRAGTFYESGAAPDEWTRVNFDAFDRFGFTAGAGATWRGITLNAAFAYEYQPTREITDSKVLPIYALEPAPAGQQGLNGIFARAWWWPRSVSA